MKLNVPRIQKTQKKLFAFARMDFMEAYANVSQPQAVVPIHVKHWGGWFAYFTYFLSILNIGGDAARNTFASFVSYVRLPLANSNLHQHSTASDYWCNNTILHRRPTPNVGGDASPPGSAPLTTSYSLLRHCTYLVHSQHRLLPVQWSSLSVPEAHGLSASQSNLRCHNAKSVMQKAWAFGPLELDIWTR